MPSILHLRADDLLEFVIAERVYLDHAGATLYSEVQLQHVMKELSNSVFGNPRIPHLLACLGSIALFMYIRVLQHRLLAPMTYKAMVRTQYNLIFTLMMRLPGLTSSLLSFAFLSYSVAP